MNQIQTDPLQNHLRFRPNLSFIMKLENISYEENEF